MQDTSLGRWRSCTILRIANDQIPDKPLIQASLHSSQEERKSIVINSSGQPNQRQLIFIFMHALHKYLSVNSLLVCFQVQ